ncbi:hypothetical protein FXW78_50335 [Rhodococcus opacus]|nr:hypothetical protein [Rhodococcus opacus]
MAWIERYLSGSALGSSRSCVRHGDTSRVEELMDDIMALLASLSGRFYPLRSKQNQRRLAGDAAHGGRWTN